ncbi:hypothetical protein RB595_009013 [Gaeumannomyces hyphopodioides]
MDPESQGREEREELLAGHGGEYEPTQTRRAAPPAPVRRLSAPVMMAVCAVSILALVGFAMPFWATTQSHPPSSGGSGGAAITSLHAGSGTAVAVTTTAAPSTTTTTTKASSPTDVIPKDEFFNLDVSKSGFVVENKPRAREYEFNITRAMGAPDGVVKPMILVNGQSPGPTVEANVGDAVRVIMYNSLANETATIHWHGIDQRNTVWMDGVPGVTQCGIPPGQSFVYEFTVPNQRGTFWYHAHVSVQYTDGLYGAIVIHDPDEKVAEHHDDRLVFMGDLHHQYGGDILSQYLSKSPNYAPGSAGTEPYPDNIIINGQHLFNCTKPSSDDASAFTGEGCTGGSRHVARVEAGKTVRLRLISHSSNTPFLFTVDGHVLEIVEMDGVEIHPVQTTVVFLNPGQRYSVLVKADRAIGNYLMRAVATCAMLDNSPGSNLGTVGSQGTAVFSYGEGVDPKGPLVVLDDSSKASVAQEPWAKRCRDLPFDLAKPVREIDAYNVGEGNKHSFLFKFVEDDQGVQRTVINDVNHLLGPPQRRHTLAGAAAEHQAAEYELVRPQVGVEARAARLRVARRGHGRAGGHQRRQHDGPPVAPARAAVPGGGLGQGRVRQARDDVEPQEPGPPRHGHGPGPLARRHPLPRRQPGRLGPALPHPVARRGRHARADGPAPHKAPGHAQGPAGLRRHQVPLLLPEPAPVHRRPLARGGRGNWPTSRVRGVGLPE